MSQALPQLSRMSRAGNPLRRNQQVLSQYLIVKRLTFGLVVEPWYALRVPACVHKVRVGVHVSVVAVGFLARYRERREGGRAKAWCLLTHADASFCFSDNRFPMPKEALGCRPAPHVSVAWVRGLGERSVRTKATTRGNVSVPCR
jgi:hypothetical protein